ncbi:hypothetical protein DIPPA_15091 [Diplonema papillatum]|nr:hypothetical protein DIPPA_15091 [Diplonema papillatum]|eukprot:gene16070-24603_t
MHRRGLLRPTACCLGLFDPVYDKNAGGAHIKRSGVLPRLETEREKSKTWNQSSLKITLRKVPYTTSSVAELIGDAEEAVAGVHRDHLEPRQRRYVNRIGIMLILVCLSLYGFTIWRFGQEVFDDVEIPDFSDASGNEKKPTAKAS